MHPPLCIAFFHCTTVPLYLWITNNIVQPDNIWSASQVLENLDLTLDLFLFDWLQNLDAALFIVGDVDTLKDLRVFASSHLAYDLVAVLNSRWKA